MTVLVTGAGGFIGGRLARPGDRRLLRRSRGGPDEAVGDLRDPAALDLACAGIETVFHCAGYAHAFHAADPALHRQINLEGTRNLVAAAGRAGVARFVFLSSVKAMPEPGAACIDEDAPGTPDTAYGVAKRAAEDAVLEAGARYGMHVVNLRLAMVYGRGGGGNLERMARGIRAGWFPALPETGNRRSLVHVDDVTAAARLVAATPAANGRTYIVADPQAYSGRQLYDAISAIVRPRGTVGAGVPAWLLRAAGAAGSLAGTLFGRPLPVNTEVVSRLLDSAWYSPARIERELDWRAATGLQAGLREMLGG